jgi:hypothetical protein
MIGSAHGHQPNGVESLSMTTARPISLIMQSASQGTAPEWEFVCQNSAVVQINLLQL